MLILACVSGHGFGHGSRVAAVLSALHRLEPSWRLVLSTPLPESFLRLAFAAVPFEHRPCRWDVGVLQADALGADATATLLALQALEQRLPAQLEQELAWVRAQDEPVLVLGDVPPAAADLAQGLGAPLVWMGNFGWEAIYRPMGGPFVAWADQALERYRRGNALIRCPFAMPMDWGLPAESVGLTSGQPQLSSEQLDALVGPSPQMDHNVIVAFGGLGLSLAAEPFRRWPEHQFWSSDPQLAAAAPNVRLIPPQLRPLELMPRCGRILTKPGYSTFCEAMAAGLGIHLVHREGFAEAPVLERALQQHAPHRLLSREQLQQGDWQLDQPLIPAVSAPPARHGERQAAQLLRDWAISSL